MSDLAYKEAKELSVTGLTGSSISSINLVSATALTSYALWASIRPRDARLEFVLVVLPLLGATTILSSPLAVTVFNALLAGAAWWCWNRRKERSALQRRLANEKGKGVAIDSLLRVSVDSSADVAHAAAAPATFYESHDDAAETRDSISPLGGRRAAVHPAQQQLAPLSTSSSAASVRSLSSPLSSVEAESRSISPAAAPPADPLPRSRPFLSVYRAHMMLMTVICILAVDFPSIFPRDQAKCESWGVSLMDLGVGSFVYSLGLVSAAPSLRARTRYEPMRAALLRDVRRATPLLILGGVRVILVKGTEYPEHISEYGVHWNFFITLALLPAFGTLLRPLAKRTRWSIVGNAVACLHQFALWNTPLQDRALRAGPRRGLLDANKEGLTSLPGYAAIFFLGLDVGHYVLPLDPYYAYRRITASRGKAKTGKTSMILGSLSLLFWAAYGALALFGAGTSRRLANLSYVLWVSAFNTSFLLGYVGIYAALLEHDVELSTPRILDTLNTHALPTFLAANLLTGVVNLSLPTIYMGTLSASLVMLLYLGACCSLPLFMQAKGLRLRL